MYLNPLGKKIPNQLQIMGKMRNKMLKDFEQDLSFISILRQFLAYVCVAFYFFHYILCFFFLLQNFDSNSSRSKAQICFFFFFLNLIRHKFFLNCDK